MAYDGSIAFDTSVDGRGFQEGANKLGDIVKGLGVFKIIEKGFGMIVNSVDRAVSRYDTLNKFPKVLEQMGFNANQSSEATQRLSDSVQGLPTALDDVVATAQRLTVLTGDLDTSVDTTIALNNAFLASGSGAADASRGLVQYTQMLSSGKVDMMSWRTLQETMGYALQKTAEAFGFAGKSAQRDLYSALLSGTITFEQFNKKIIDLNRGVGGFAEMAMTSSGGIATAFTNMHTRVAAGVTEVINAIDRGLSKTRFKSIENIINSTGTAIKNALTKLAAKATPVIEALAKALSVLIDVNKKLLPVMGVIAAGFLAYKAYTFVINFYEGLVLIKAGYVALLKAEGIATAGTTAALKAYNLAQNAKMLLLLPANAAIIVHNALTGASIPLLGGATAAQWGLNAAMLANPIGVMIAGIAALIVGIIALVSWLSKASSEFRHQREEVNALTEAQKELSTSVGESETSYKTLTGEIDANAKVTGELIEELKSLQSSTDDTEEKSKQMAVTVDKLNSAVDGLNVSYDEEAKTIRNLNSGQAISIDQLEDLLKAKTEIAKANAWAERANELTKEQIKTQEQLAFIEAKRQEIIESENLKVGEKQRLLEELDKSEKEHASNLEDIGLRIKLVNDNIENSNTEMAESVVSDYELMNRAITENGENIETVAAQWNVSVNDIMTAMKLENINLDEWVEKQEKAWEDFENAVKDRTQGVINSFKEIPGEYEQSAEEMLEILKNNKERYAEWEATMEEITRQLGPTAAEEFAKLGPEATSAMKEILGSAEMLDEYRDVFGVKLDEVTGLAVEDWNDPNFIGAPSEAIDSSAQKVTENTALDTAITETIEGAKTAAEGVDFSDIGQGIAAGISEGISSSATSMSTSIEKALKKMSTESQSIVSQMMTGINSAIITRIGAIRASVTSLGNGITAALDRTKTQTIVIANQISSGILNRLNLMVEGAYIVSSSMMDGIGRAMDNKSESLYSKARYIANRIARTMADALEVRSPSRVLFRIFSNVMMGIFEAMQGKSGLLFKKAEDISDGLAERLSSSPGFLRSNLNRLSSLSPATSFSGFNILPQPAIAGEGGINYSTTLVQHITTPKPLSPSEITREGQDMLRRQRYRLR